MSTEKKSQIHFPNVITVFRREFLTYFDTPIGYIFLAVFTTLVFALLFRISNFWDVGMQPDLMFLWMRLVFVFVIPAITMRLWAEERRAGTIEFLLTMPFTAFELILGKFLSALSFLAVAIGATFFFVITLIVNASPDWVTLINAYLGALLLGAAYISTGLFISWSTKNQIVAYLISVVVFGFTALLGYKPLLELFGPLKNVIAFFSLSWHYDSLATGLIDTRDILFFGTFIALFIYLNKKAIEKWQGRFNEITKKE